MTRSAERSLENSRLAPNLLSLKQATGKADGPQSVVIARIANTVTLVITDGGLGSVPVGVFRSHQSDHAFGECLAGLYEFMISSES